MQAGEEQPSNGGVTGTGKAGPLFRRPHYDDPRDRIVPLLSRSFYCLDCNPLQPPNH
jgi:hypothetical protein